MKTTLFFFSFLLLAFSTTSLLVAADPVLDVDGNELQASESYYALPLFINSGGGFVLAGNINGSICPLHVVQTRFSSNKGLPLKFSSIVGKEDVIRESTILDIQFVNIPNICHQSAVWTVNGDFITIGGDGGSIISNFRIQKSQYFPNIQQTYKFVYCFARRACQDIGLSVVNGIRYLAVSSEPWEVVFVKAAVEGSKIRKITDGLLSF